MNKYKSKCILMLAFLILSSCLTSQPVPPIPALLVQPSADSHMILEHAIGDLLNSQPIKLAHSVFLHKSTVIIEPKQFKDNRRNILDGREIRSADTFSLLTEKGLCYLKHDQSQNIIILKNISCSSK